LIISGEVIGTDHYAAPRPDFVGFATVSDKNPF
jgi:hypothetical protein